MIVKMHLCCLIHPASDWTRKQEQITCHFPQTTHCTSSTSYQKTYFRHCKWMCNVSATHTQECHHVVLSRKLMSLSTSLWNSIQEQYRTTKCFFFRRIATCFFLQKDRRNCDKHGKLTSMAATPDAHTLMKPSTNSTEFIFTIKSSQHEMNKQTTCIRNDKQKTWTRMVGLLGNLCQWFQIIMPHNGSQGWSIMPNTPRWRTMPCAMKFGRFARGPRNTPPGIGDKNDHHRLMNQLRSKKT